MRYFKWEQSISAFRSQLKEVNGWDWNVAINSLSTKNNSW